MRSTPLSPLRLLTALELFGPQARPYNFDDHFDCWGLAQRVFDWIDEGDDLNQELLGEETVDRWEPFGGRDEVLPGDLLTTHPHPDGEFHTAFYCGRAGEVDVVYDSSPRGLIPLFDERLRWVADREIFTRYARATETTDRLRDDGGAYLRLWHDGMRYYHRGLHERLVAGGAAGERDLVTLRRAAGLTDLPFYCRRRLPRDVAGRELYDNLHTRHLDYYVPDGAPVPDDAYEAVERGETGAVARRPAAPVFERSPAWVCDEEPGEVVWRHDDGVTVVGCRIELWEETWDIWRHRLLRIDADEPLTRWIVPAELLHDDSRFAVVVSSLGEDGHSRAAVAPFLMRPRAENPLLTYNPVRPRRLRPDAGAAVPPGRDVELSWDVPDPEHHQSATTILVSEDSSCLATEPAVVYRREIAAAGRSHRVPATAVRSGHTYYWYVTVVNDAGLPCFAPAEGVFTVTERG